MRESKNHSIDGYTYTITQLGAKTGRTVLARVLRVVAGALGAAQGLEDTTDAAAAIAAKLAGSLTDEELTFLCDTFEKTTQFCKDGEPEKTWALAGQFDNHFAGRYGSMAKWLWAALETNYSSFLSGLGLNAEALGEKAKALMGGSPASLTPPSGGSSSPASGG